MSDDMFTGVLLGVVLSAVLLIGMLLSSDLRTVPSCQEDEVVVGTGDYDGDHWDDYGCEPFDDLGCTYMYGEVELGRLTPDVLELCDQP